MEGMNYESVVLHGKTTSLDVLPLEVTVYSYVPDLTGFRAHVSNYYAELISKLPDQTVLAPTHATFQKYAYGILVVMSHLINHEIYKRGGYRTDSVNKILRNCIGQTLHPTWLCDIAREISRPMVSNNTVYVPYFNDAPVSHGDTKTMESFGIGVAQASQMYTILDSLVKRIGMEDMRLRSLVEEGVTFSALMVSDGEFTFFPNEVTTWRKQAWYQLQHFQNGCSTTGYGYAAADTPWVISRDNANSLSVDARLYFQVDKAARIVAAGTPNQISTRLLPAVISGIPYRPRDTDAVGQHFLFWSADRDVVYNTWLDRPRAGAAFLPPLKGRCAEITGMLEYTKRFPTDTSHSKTPGSSPQAAYRKQVKPKASKASRRRKQREKTAADVSRDETEDDVD